MIKIFLVLWMLVDGQASGPPIRFSMDSLEECVITVADRLNVAMEATGDTGTQYMAACVVEKVRPA